MKNTDINEIKKLIIGSNYLFYLKKDYPEFVQWIKINLYGQTFAEKLYNFLNNRNESNKCLICNKETKFYNIKKGYAKYCSIACSKLCPIIKENRKQTCLRKYGVEYISQDKLFLEKREKTWMSPTRRSFV